MTDEPIFLRDGRVMRPDVSFHAKVLTVAELTRAIRGTLETKFGAVWVQGEISNYKLHPSGHQYFTLKDQRAAIACVIFRNTLPPFPNAAGRRRAGAGLRQRLRLRSARSISAQRPDSADARPRSCCRRNSKP